MQKQNENETNGCKTPEISLEGDVSVIFGERYNMHYGSMKYGTVGDMEIRLVEHETFGRQVEVEGQAEMIEKVKSINGHTLVIKGERRYHSESGKNVRAIQIRMRLAEWCEMNGEEL